MDGLRPYLGRLEAVAREAERAAFIAGARELEAAVLDALRRQLTGDWRPGSGAAAASMLAAWKDEVIAAILRRTGDMPEGFAVLAVGGYGRRELAPFSDVDLLMLCRRQPDASLAARISDLQYHLWDLGYQPSASARTVRDIDSDARGDPHFLTSLLSSRLLGGDAALADAAAGSLARVLSSTRRRFVAERMADAESLLERSGREVLVKEPDLKNSAGGLRTVQLMQWLTAGDLRPFLPAALHMRLSRAYDFLLYLRGLLHLLANRKEDVLRIDWQLPVAEALGLHGSDGQKMVKLMRHVYERTTDVALALQVVVEGVAAQTGRRPGRLDRASALPAAAPRPAGPADPAASLEAAARAAGRGRSGSLIADLALAARAIDRQAVGSRELFVRFRDLLLLPDSYPLLISLKLSGFLYAYVRPLGRVRHRIVHNPFHRYTVDQHSLEAVRELEAFSGRAAADPERYKLPATVAATYRDSIWVVKLALLLHDVGKAYEGDHAKNSAEMARGWLRDLPTEGLIKDMIVFLTENHLLLSAIARRGDLESEAVIGNLASELARQAYPEEALDLLFLLTCADIAATNERAYSGYTAATLATLFLRTSAAVSRVHAAQGESSVVEERIASLLDRGAGSRVSDFVRALGPRYCLANLPADILEDFGDVLSLEPEAFRLRVSVFNDHVRIKIIARDRVGLFSLLSGILLANGADIVRARIHTFGGIAIDEFIIADVHGNEILEQKMEKELSIWIADLRASFERYWASPGDLDHLISDIGRRTRPANAAFVRDTRVRIDRGGSTGLRIEVACTDRPALLYDLTHRMASLGLDVRSAAVDTTGWYVHDTFDADTKVGVDDQGLERLRNELADLAAPR